MATSGFTMLAAMAVLNFEHTEYIREHWRRKGPGNAGSKDERNALAAAIKAFAEHPADPEKVQRQKWLLRNAEIITPAIGENDIDAEFCFWSTSPHVLADDVVCNVFTAFRKDPANHMEKAKQAKAGRRRIEGAERMRQCLVDEVGEAAAEEIVEHRPQLLHVLVLAYSHGSYHIESGGTVFTYEDQTKVIKVNVRQVPAHFKFVDGENLACLLNHAGERVATVVPCQNEEIANHISHRASRMTDLWRRDADGVLMDAEGWKAEGDFARIYSCNWYALQGTRAHPYAENGRENDIEFCKFRYQPMHELSDEEKLLNKWLSRDHEGKRQYVYGEMVLNERIMCAGRIPPLFGGTHCPAAFARQAIADEPWTRDHFDDEDIGWARMCKSWLGLGDRTAKKGNCLIFPNLGIVLDLAHGASVYFDSVHVRHSVTETWWSRKPAAGEVFPSPCLLSAFIKDNLLTHCGWNPHLVESPCTRYSRLDALDERAAKKRKVKKKKKKKKKKSRKGG